MQPPATFTAARQAAIVATLPPNARQLVQVGAGDGALARSYRDSYPASALVVLEGDPAAAQRAQAFAERVVQVQLDSAGASLFTHLQWADCWLFDETLETLAAPARVLAAIRGAMQYDACVLACVSNPDAGTPQHGLDAPALQTLFSDAGFRIASAISLSPGAPQAGQPAPRPTHFLIKAMPA
ncbi:MAG: hypothetical protein K0R43_4200 [Pseudoduganella sp.]|jgi:hypothetical protein|nr:hypothetical protein [Pseudoduganella sp.]